MEVPTQEEGRGIVSGGRLILNNAEAFNNLVESKTWAGSRGKPSRVIFDSPRDFFEPYMEFAEGVADAINEDIVAHADYSHEVSNQNADDSYNTSYGRARVEFRIPGLNMSIANETFTQVFGVIYAFDLSSPEVIVYAGRNANSCLNLHIFNASNVYKTDYLTGTAMAFQTFQRYMDGFQEEMDQFEITVERLMTEKWRRDQLNQKLGQLLVHVVSDVSFGTSALNHAVKLLHDPGSRYAVDAEGSTSPWNVLQALTQYVTDKTPVNIAPTKTHQMAREVLKLV